jgi:glycosyltransferase involved in cell wall biosynthesis
MQLPRISIVTPSYNQAKYLPETIDSILGQKYPNLEYIIVDGGSTDGSVDIIRKHEDYLAYWVSEKDRGQSDAINKGFRKSSGALFNWINSDDVLFPDALQRIASTYVAHPSVDIVAGGHAVCSEDGTVIWASAPPSMWALFPEYWVHGSGQQSTFVTADALKRVGGIREDLHLSMDMDLYYRILTSGGRRATVHGLIGMIRKHEDAKGAKHQRTWHSEQDRLFSEYGISPRGRELAHVKSRGLRIIDGTYLRSLCLLYQWKGRKPWEGK